MESVSMRASVSGGASISCLGTAAASRPGSRPRYAPGVRRWRRAEDHETAPAVGERYLRPSNSPVAMSSWQSRYAVPDEPQSESRWRVVARVSAVTMNHGD
jgi:hypothetical protein